MMTFDEAKYALAELTNDEGYKGLSAEAKQQAIFDLAKEISVETTGTKTVLYSGYVDGKRAMDIAEAMADADSNIRIINKTDVGKFLDSVEFKDAIAQTEGLTEYKWDTALELTEVKNKLYHPTNSPWAEASKRFVSSAKGEIMLIAGEGRETSVFN
ncbi:MAG: hypothetical protein LBG67_00875, partial [Campylobacteraceae bacterium]|nr:hypothetical protein [Campylobacteraceae bacterium]